ncbi:MAG: RNA polymerase sigma factor [Deltaproteobacteria bacterium]|nr:RNA polymerase sigma factor [Deltaproteobacteria bacterium]
MSAVGTMPQSEPHAPMTRHLRLVPTPPRAFGPAEARAKVPASPSTQEGPTDAELVAAARRGERAAEEAIYKRHVRAVAGVAARLLGGRQDVDDVVQDTFVDVLDELDDLQDPAALRGWILRIAVHKVHRRFRRRKLLRALGLWRGGDDETLAAQASNAATSEQRAELALLTQVLDRVPARERTAWVLRHVEGHPLEDVAAACDCSLATVKRWIAAADVVVRAHVRMPAEEGGADV